MITELQGLRSVKDLMYVRDQAKAFKLLLKNDPDAIIFYFLDPACNNCASDRLAFRPQDLVDVCMDCGYHNDTLDPKAGKIKVRQSEREAANGNS